MVVLEDRLAAEAAEREKACLKEFTTKAQRTRRFQRPSLRSQ
jgi:hypothetical protein